MNETRMSERAAVTPLCCRSTTFKQTPRRNIRPWARLACWWVHAWVWRFEGARLSVTTSDSTTRHHCYATQLTQAERLRNIGHTSHQSLRAFAFDAGHCTMFSSQHHDLAA